MNNTGLKELEQRIRRDLDILDYPKRPWIRSRKLSNGRPILDVLIIGGGQSGLAAAFGLMREKVHNLLVIDENPDFHEGPWRTFARMHTLRTPKHLVGPDLGIPSLAIRSWYEAKYGEGAWEYLKFVPKIEWAEYLKWYRQTLGIPVKNLMRAQAIEWIPEENCFAIPVVRPIGLDVLHARKVILATGIDGSGRWEIPALVKDNLPKSYYAHTREDIDFRQLKGKTIGILGAGASAFDNASVALEEGAGNVHLFFRRKELVRTNPYRWAEFVGFLRHHADMDDANKWRTINQLMRMGQLPPADTYARATSHKNFELHPCSEPKAIREENGRIVLDTEKETFKLDFLIIGTGFKTDLSLRRELARVHENITLWKDVYTPPENDQNPDLGNHPYLGPHFEFIPRDPVATPWMKSIFNYTFGCLPSLGFGGASISGMKYSIPKLIGGVTGQLYSDDVDYYFNSLCDYSDPEF